MPSISVIVPVYNTEKYIEKCLNSLINQTLRDIEIIVVNDGSQDLSKEIIQKYIKKCNKIKYLEKENGGLSSARNYGLKYATGRYIAFLDSDDYVEEDMYKAMYEKAEEEKSDIVECDFIWEYGKKKKYDKRKEYKNKRDMMKRPRAVAWNKIIRREIIEENKILFPEGLIYEDLEFYYKILLYANKISYVERYFIHYVQREESISNTQSEKVGDIFQILNNIVCFYIEKGKYSKYRKELQYMSARIRFGSSMKRILKIKDRKLRNKLIRRTIDFKVKENNSVIYGITKLDIGGAERVLVDMVNNLCKYYNITIFTIYSDGKLEKELDKKIKTMSLFKSKNKLIPIYLFVFGKFIYNKYIKNRYDTEVAFLEGPITRLFSFRGESKKIAWVHNDIENVFGKGIKAELKKKVDKIVYRKYKLIVFVSKENQKSFNNLYGNEFKEKVIYNFIDKKRIMNLGNEETNFEMEHPCILTVARLVEQKGIDRFVRIHKRLIDDGIKHKIYVIGDGKERKKLEDIIRNLGVEKSFYLLGEILNPYPYIKKCDFFALLSYYEGYGIVLEEAKIFNKSIIITDTAAKEAIEDYREDTCIMENNEEQIYQGLRKLLGGK